VCLVYEAARATSAAPTYFPFQKISGRSFVDGGMEFNNPSYTIYEHYSEYLRISRSRRTSVATEAGVQTAPAHGNLDFSRLRIVNLGTGTEPSTPDYRRGPGFFAYVVPPAVRRLAFLKRTLTKIATNSENEAKKMNTIAHVSRSGDNPIEFKRFSANNGVCYIELDKYKELERGGKIETLTRTYLGTEETQEKLKQVANDMAKDYLDIHPVRTRPTSLTVPGQRLSRPQASAFQMPQNIPQPHNAESSRSTSGNYSERSTHNRTSSEPSTEPSPGPADSVGDPIGAVDPYIRAGEYESVGEPSEPRSHSSISA
jgi:Patatin-like phospholipase